MLAFARLHRIALGAGLGVLFACPSEPVDDEPRDTTGGSGAAFGLNCEPDAELPCTCANGASGVQVCFSDGFSAGACTCPAQPDPTAASTTLPPLPSGESSSGTGDDSNTDNGSGSSAGDGSDGSSDTGGSTTAS